MKEDKEDLRVRTKAFALRILRLYSALPERTDAQVVGRQLLRRARRSGQIIGKPFVRVQMPNSLQRWEIV